MISPHDLALMHFVETAEDGWAIVKAHYGLEVLKEDVPPAGRDSSLHPSVFFVVRRGGLRVGRRMAATDRAKSA